MSDKHIREDQQTDTPPARPAAPENGKTDQLKEREKEAESRQEALIDEAVEETMVASDPATPKRIT